MKFFYCLWIPLLCWGKGPGAGTGHAVDRNKIFLVVDKLAYRVYVYEDITLIRSYPAVFGNKDLEDKRMEGDKETPEGIYYIVAKKMDPRWSRFLLLDYPNSQDLEKFRERKAEGLIPPGARVGNGIGIHGTWPRDGFVFRYRQNWTDGCISIPNQDIDELYDLVETGTPVVIRH